MATKKKAKIKVKSQFDSLLKIHKERLAKAEEENNSHIILSASVEIRRVETLIAEELKNKEKLK